MTFTYDPAAQAGTATALHNVRLQIGDTDTASALFTDEELGVYLANRADNVLLSAADACDALALRFARAYDINVDGQDLSRSQMSQAYRNLAKDLRARAGGVATVDVTKVDGYSSDVENQTVLGGTANPRHYYARVGVDQLP